MSRRHHYAALELINISPFQFEHCSLQTFICVANKNVSTSNWYTNPPKPVLFYKLWRSYHAKTGNRGEITHYVKCSVVGDQAICKPGANTPSSQLVGILDTSLQWRHNGRDGVSNHHPHDCILNRLFRRRSKKTWKPRVTCLCEGNSPVTGEFPAQKGH